MEPVDYFRVERVSDTVGRSLLLQDGKAVAIVDGVALEAQFAFEHGYLIFASDDNPYEEILHIHLFDPSYRLLDSVCLGRPYCSGLLRDVAVGNNCVEFSFFGGDRWRLIVRSKPRSAFFLWPLSPDRLHRWLRARYLELDRC
jgi:hypothetical protein